MAAEIVGREPEPGGATSLALRSRPWHVFSGRLTCRLDELADTGVWSMDAVETAETVVELRRAQARAGGRGGGLLAHAERLDVAASTGATSTAAWLRGQLRVTRGHRPAGGGPGARRWTPTPIPRPRPRWRPGELLPDQARVIIAAIDALPDRLFAEERLRGEAHLVELRRLLRRRAAGPAGPAPAGGHRPRPGRAGARPAVGGRGRGRGAGHLVPDVRRRPRQGPRPVRAAQPARPDAAQARRRVRQPRHPRPDPPHHPVPTGPGNPDDATPTPARCRGRGPMPSVRRSGAGHEPRSPARCSAMPWCG